MTCCVIFEQKYQHENKLYTMYKSNITSKNIQQSNQGNNDTSSKRFNQNVSRKSTSQERGHEGGGPPVKKPKKETTVNSTVHVEDDVWGEDLDENTLEECFFLASQVLSQTSATHTAKKEEGQSSHQINRHPPTFKQKQIPVFVRNKPSVSRKTESFPEQNSFFFPPSTNMPIVTEQRDPLQRNNSSNSRPSSRSNSPSLKPMEMVSQNQLASTAKVTRAPGEAVVSVSATNSLPQKYSVVDDDERNSLIRELQQLKMANKKLQDQILTKEGEISILRTQLNNTKGEIETQRLTKTRELEVQAQDYKDKLKGVEKELEQTKTLLEFKSLEVGNAQDRCRLLESQSKVKLVEPKISVTPVKFPRNLPGKSSIDSPSSHKKVEGVTRNDLIRESIASEIHINEGSVLSTLVTPALFEKPLHGAERISFQDLRRLPLLMDEFGGNLTPSDAEVNITHTAVSKLLLKDSLDEESAQLLIKRVVWQCYFILVKQRNIVMQHRVPRKKEKLRQIDFKITEAAGRLVGGNGNVMTARPWYTNEQGVETRRALGLLAALAMVSKFAAQYILGIISLANFTPRRLIKPQLPPQTDNNRTPPVIEERSYISQPKCVKISKDLKEKIAKRCIADRAICRARKCMREAKLKKSVVEAEKEPADLCNAEQKPVVTNIFNQQDYNSSREVTRDSLLYKKYMEKIKNSIQSNDKAKQQLKTPSGPSSAEASSIIQSRIMNLQEKVKKQNTEYKLDNCTKKSLYNSSKEGTSACAYVAPETSVRKGDADENNRLAQPGTSKDSASSDDNLFKKPFPVEKSIIKHKKLKKSHQTLAQTSVEDEAEGKNVKKEMRRYWIDMKTFSMSRASHQQRFIHPVVLACQENKIDILKNRIKKLHLSKKKPLLAEKKKQLLKLEEGLHAKQTANLVKTLCFLMQLICTHRLTVHFNGVIFGIVHLLKAISSKAEFTVDRLNVVSDIVKQVILCRPCVNVLMELTDLLFSLGKYRIVMDSLCTGNGPSPYIGRRHKVGVVHFVAGKPHYDVESDSEVEYFNKDSCMISLLCWLLLTQRAGIRQYVVLGSNLIRWLECASSQEEDNPYWIGSNEHISETRDCQCRARIIEAVLKLLYIGYEHIKTTNFHKDKLFYDIRRLLGGGLRFLHGLVHQDSDVGLLMANAEGEYQVLVHGLRDNLEFMDFSEEKKEALKVLITLEDEQDESSEVLTYDDSVKVTMDNLFKMTLSFCGPSYK
ncbi:uncharacterized protein [Periplaneta americana]|uniref:uncharacterized protein isoform X2 n=1 Tax=Periplaneta americana TaxID=6978 RepID=UPI0037E93784